MSYEQMKIILLTNFRTLDLYKLFFTILEEDIFLLILYTKWNEILYFNYFINALTPNILMLSVWSVCYVLIGTLNTQQMTLHYCVVWLADRATANKHGEGSRVQIGVRY